MAATAWKWGHGSRGLSVGHRCNHPQKMKSSNVNGGIQTLRLIPGRWDLSFLRNQMEGIRNQRTQTGKQGKPPFLKSKWGHEKGSTLESKCQRKEWSKRGNQRVLGALHLIIWLLVSSGTDQAQSHVHHFHLTTDRLYVHPMLRLHESENSQYVMGQFPL